MKKQNPIIEDETGPPSNSAPELNFEEFRPLLADENLSETEQNELLEILWNIAGTFARMGHSVNPMEMILAQNQDSTWLEAETTVEQECCQHTFNRNSAGGSAYE